ncbi:YtxH domain-containing protein [Flavobacterium sp. PL12]|uniref:YtxH domain-containing protein n=1 Tax=Flavobacterium sp. PL12 TaxID=3071718 RepID=UPI00319DE654
MKNSKSGMLFALLAGATIGAGLGILYAPKKGKKIRKKIKNSFKDSKDLVTDAIKDAKEAVHKII